MNLEHCQKNATQNFERWSSNRVVEANVQGGSDFHVSSSIPQHTCLLTLKVKHIGAFHTGSAQGLARILSRAISVNTLQLGSEIPSLHSKSEPIFVHTGGSGQAQLRLGSEISEPSPEPSQCEMPHSFNLLEDWSLDGSGNFLWLDRKWPHNNSYPGIHILSNESWQESRSKVTRVKVKEGQTKACYNNYVQVASLQCQGFLSHHISGKPQVMKNSSKLRTSNMNYKYTNG